MFHDFLGFLGVDPRRVTFSWVSASEGAKWRDVVDEAVANVRAAGPFKEYRALAPDVADAVASAAGGAAGEAS